jgi:hypothetical protein
VAEQTTTINVSWRNSTGDRVFQQFPVTTVTYRGDDDNRLIYDAGAVFRLSRPDGPGAVLREPPSVVTPERTVITIPQTTAVGTSAISGSTALIRATKQGELVRARVTQVSNIWINVTSPHWRAWRTTLDERTNIDCRSSDPATDIVSCELLSGASPDVFYVTQTQVRVALTR